MSVEIITAPALRGLVHGFFGRRGGASSGIFAGLNCGLGSSDQSEAVRLNRARAAHAIGVAPEALVSLMQVHSPDVVTLHGPQRERPEGDAMVTATTGVALGILTADCAPVLLADRDAGVVGAAHAGWKGALGGVLENTVTAMEALGAERARIEAAVGPTIAQASYEVDLDFMGRFLADDDANQRFFAGGRDADHVQFDLPGYVVNRLRGAGVRCAWTGHDTYAEPARFFSFRRTTHDGKADYGRLLSAIRL